jgi:hypothetical protein
MVFRLFVVVVGERRGEHVSRNPSKKHFGARATLFERRQRRRRRVSACARAFSAIARDARAVARVRTMVLACVRMRFQTSLERTPCLARE